MPTKKSAPQKRSSKQRASSAKRKTAPKKSATTRTTSKKTTEPVSSVSDFDVAELEARVEAMSQAYAVIEFEPDGTIIDANDNFLNTVGYTLNEIVGKHHRIFVRPDYAASSEYDYFWRDLQNGVNSQGEFERVGKDGKSIWIQARYTPISDEDGEVYKVIKYASDITEAKTNMAEMSKVQAMIKQATAMVFCDVDLIVRYMNPTALKTLTSLEQHLPVPAAQIVGQSIDIFHKDPAHQRRILANPANLPLVTQIPVGPETLDLEVKPVYNEENELLGTMVTWEVVTEKLAAEKEMSQAKAMIQQASAMVFADNDLVVRYMNPAALKTLRSLEKHLPVRADDIVGQSIDIFHKDPAHQRGILANPANLPLTTQIPVGPERLDLEVKPVFDENDNHLGTMVTWEVVTEKLAMEAKIKEKADEDRRQAEETQAKVESILNTVNAVADGKFDVDFPDLGNDAIGQVSQAMAKAIASVRETLVEVRDVSTTVATASTQMSSAAEEISLGAQQQAARLEETASSLEEITTTVKQNTQNAQEARALANSSRDVATEGGQVVSDAVQAMSEINDSSKKIADIITTIDEIAFQTNLLALNAAVEAARAGEQGRGFAVVAAEVRNLAQRSASSAKEIKSLIQDSNGRVEKGTELVNKSGQTLGEIVDSVKRVTDIVAEIAAASQEQLSGIEQVNKAVTQMDHVTQANASQTEELAGTSNSVLNHAKSLDQLVSVFRLGENGNSHRPSSGGHGAGMTHSSSQQPSTAAQDDDDDFMDF